MTTWINVGVRVNLTNSDISTKKALKEHLVSFPQDILMYSTDAFGPNRDKTWKADNLEIGVKYSVTGPNPYTSRKWYATVEKLADGKVTVK